MAAPISPGVGYRIGAEGLVIVRLDDGDLRIDGVDGDMVRIIDLDGGLDGLTIEAGERSLSIGSAQATGRDMALDVPTGATVIVEARSSDVVTTRLTGETRLTTASGDISMSAAGGVVTIDAVSGDVRIAAENALELQARTVSGDLDVRAERIGRLGVITTSGDVSVAALLEGAGPFAIETVSGDATIESYGPVLVEATTLTGDIHGPSPERRGGPPGPGRGGPIAVGTAGGPTLAFRSTSGDLSVTVGRSASSTDEMTITATDITDPSLDVLRALERGEIDVAQASERLAAMDRDGVDDA
jgi:hypothetical protein